jgi:hypothetical protein
MLEQPSGYIVPPKPHHSPPISSPNHSPSSQPPSLDDEDYEEELHIPDGVEESAFKFDDGGFDDAALLVACLF